MRCLMLLMAVAAGAAESDRVTVDLPVYEPASATGDRLAGDDRAGRRADAERGGLLGKLQLVGALGQRLAAASAPVKEPEGRGLFEPAPRQEAATFDPEDPISKTISIRDNLHQAVSGVFRPRPIVDTLREEVKYGNEGDRFLGAGRAIVRGAAGVSQAVNSVLEVPGRIFRKISRTATESLNNLGGRLIGL